MNGYSAVITGGGRGVGAAVAARLAQAGVRVLLAARTDRQVNLVAEQLRASGHTAYAAVCDVADEASVSALADLARLQLGRVDILVNNAGTAMAAPLRRTTLADWNRLMMVNATGAFLTMRAVMPGMIERCWGRVVNVASVAGLKGGPYISAYAASKHALVGLTRAAAAEAAAHGVTVNAICPGYLDTDMTRETVARVMKTTGRSEQETLDSILQSMPQRRLIGPEEVAETVAFLCTEAARGINGATLVIDGGELKQ